MDDLTRYKIFALACALVVFAYVLFNGFDALREWSAIARAKKHARDSRLRTFQQPPAAGAVSRAIEPERAARVRVAAPQQREAA